MTQPIGLDRDRAVAAALDGIARADEHANEHWKALADDLIRRLALRQPTLTSEDVWEMGLPENPTGSNAALGARFRAAQSAGWIVRTDRTTPTLAHGKHGSQTVVWASLLYRGPDAVAEARRVGDAADLREALTVLYWCARRGYDLAWPEKGRIAPGTREADLRRVLGRVADLIGRPRPWGSGNQGDENWLPEWLAAEIDDAAPGLLSRCRADH
jgi:hypothetical protein